MKIAKKHNLYFKWLKCDFDIKEISILEVVVGREEVQIEKNKIKAIKGWKISTKIKKSRNFLEVCKKNFSHMAKSINKFKEKKK